MKWILVIIAVFVVAWLLIPRNRITQEHSETGKIDRLQPLIESLMHSEDDYAYLRVNIEGREEFLQMTADKTGAQINFPLVQKSHLKLESVIRDVSKENGYHVEDNSGSDGTKFIDINVNGDSEEVSKVCEKLLSGVFKSKDHTVFQFHYSGFEGHAL